MPVSISFPSTFLARRSASRYAGTRELLSRLTAALLKSGVLMAPGWMTVRWVGCLKLAPQGLCVRLQGPLAPPRTDR